MLILALTMDFICWYCRNCSPTRPHF